MRYVGTKKAKEISLTKNPAQPLARVLVKKSLEEDPKVQQAETDEMDVKKMQRVATMSDVTKAYFGGLEEEAAKAFLDLSHDEQDKKAAEAKKSADAEAEKAKRDAKAAKTADGKRDQDIADVQKENGDLKAQIDGLKREREVDKMLAEDRFRGYPGGKDELAKVVSKALDQKDDEVQKMLLDGAAEKAASARLTGTEMGVRTEHDVQRDAPTTHEVYKEADRRAQANGTDRFDEVRKMAKEPAWSAKVDKVYQEQGAGLH